MQDQNLRSRTFFLPFPPLLLSPGHTLCPTHFLTPPYTCMYRWRAPLLAWCASSTAPLCAPPYPNKSSHTAPRCSHLCALQMADPSVGVVGSSTAPLPSPHPALTPHIPPQLPHLYVQMADPSVGVVGIKYRPVACPSSYGVPQVQAMDKRG